MAREHALEIAPRIWWVGHHFDDDPFQCHSYLIENGDQSILLDPGSVLTFESTLKKVEEVVPLSAIRYFICHHQDPDITGILPHLDARITRDDAMVLSHWRANALIKHLGLKNLPLICVEQQDWQLDLGAGRTLQFIFTPYLHFSGAFCTFDPTTGTLFSSDLFGGISDNTPLYARDEQDFEAIQFFHEHYMPSQEILRHGISNLETLPIRLIAPQHGSLIPGHLIDYIFNRLKNLDCGLFLLTRTNSNYQRLSNLNRMLREMMRTLMVQRDFSSVANRILELAQPLIPVVGLEFYALTDTDETLHLAPENSFRGQITPAPVECRVFLGMDRHHWSLDHSGPYLITPYPGTALTPTGEPIEQGLILPLFSPQNDLIQAVVLFRLSSPLHIDDEMANILTQLSIPLGVAVEREIILHMMELEKKRSYERSIRDPLTGLFTRYYMHEALHRLSRIHDRDPQASIAILAYDIDHFKSINDNFGHAMGDVTLRVVAHILMDSIRGVDIPVRLGGEEFLVFLIGTPEKTTREVAERIRLRVQHQQFDPPMQERTVTISCGIAFRKAEEPIETAIERADLALYQAKSSGRNKVVVCSGHP
ncbi:MAG: diguanylate cyclase [Magnetococcales bacterium]|nr:diguanylate cyclase [Magnetococcales bacterium]NGZ05551.1 diguanylate cyclase [Magnetococcales bacterium]